MRMTGAISWETFSTPSLDVFGSMTALILTTGIWFLIASVALFILSRWYVSALLLLSRHGRIAKFSGGTVLWLGLSVLLVAPLFGVLLFEQIRQASSNDWLFSAWIGGAFIFCSAPTVYYICVHRISKLRRAGYHLEEDI
jgi:hypothetical protein